MTTSDIQSSSSSAPSGGGQTGGKVRRASRQTSAHTQGTHDAQPEWKKRVPSVSVLTRQLRGHLESSFFDVWIRGEISNFRRPVSGHGYFVLKDAQAQIRAVVFRNRLSRIKCELEDGMDVILHGSVSVYEARGEYQIICDHVEPLGTGALQMAFDRLKAKLQKEGLFQQKHKKPLPSLPKRIGVITSATGAAVRDILTVLYRRFPNRQTLIIPASVQGERAGGEIATAIQSAEAWNQSHPTEAIELLIVGRGGGSMEDLWPFNEEIVARAIFDCPIPVISAVGHEIDFTIADFVADVRAPTPSAAAELAVPEYRELVLAVTRQQQSLQRCLQKQMQQWRLHLDHLSRRLIDPRQKLAQQKKQMDHLIERAHSAMKNSLQRQRSRCLPHSPERMQRTVLTALKLKRQQFESLTSQLHQLSPLQTVQRGFSITQSTDGQILRSIEQVSAGQTLLTRVSDGEIRSKVQSTHPSSDI